MPVLSEQFPYLWMSVFPDVCVKDSERRPNCYPRWLADVPLPRAWNANPQPGSRKYASALCSKGKVYPAMSFSKYGTTSQVVGGLSIVSTKGSPSTGRPLAEEQLPRLLRGAVPAAGAAGSNARTGSACGFQAVANVARKHGRTQPLKRSTIGEHSVKQGPLDLPGSLNVGG